MPQPLFDQEFHRKYECAMGAELGPLYVGLMQDVLWLNDKWEQFLSLFGHSKERVAVLNDAASHLFGLLQEVFWSDVLLHMARLTDRPSVADHDTLSLRALPGLLPDNTVRSEIEGSLTILLSQVAFARDWRNRRLAHTDRDLALKQLSAKPLQPGKRSEVSNALKTMSDILNKLDAHYCNTNMQYEDFSIVSDTDALIDLIQRGMSRRNG